MVPSNKQQASRLLQVRTSTTTRRRRPRCETLTCTCLPQQPHGMGLSCGRHPVLPLLCPVLALRQAPTLTCNDIGDDIYHKQASYCFGHATPLMNLEQDSRERGERIERGGKLAPGECTSSQGDATHARRVQCHAKYAIVWCPVKDVVVTRVFCSCRALLYQVSCLSAWSCGDLGP